LLDSNDVDFVKQCLADISGDVEQPITYRRYVNTTPGNQVMGTTDTPNYDDLSIDASVRDLTLEEVEKSGGAYVLGDVEFKIRHTKLPSKPAYADRLIYDESTFKPKSITHSYLGGVLSWTIRAGKK
jgi:hypothetical protein